MDLLDLCENHPGLNDQRYLDRRRNFHKLVKEGFNEITYTDYENELWCIIYIKLKEIHNKYACKSYLDNFKLLEENNIFTHNKIPQLKEINDFLYSRTKFTLKPVNGLISSREFLNSLAKREFNCTLYIRHESKPFYTPEPDIVHEFLGHVPLFADEDFAELSEKIGKASLGMNEEELLKLTRFYWFTIEFGLCEEDSKTKVYGAGILSSIGEMEYSVGKKATVREFKVKDIIEQDYPVTTYQPVYYKVSTFEEAKRQLLDFVKINP